MKIHEFYYDQDKRSLYVEFSTKQDKDRYFRRLDVTFKDVEYYSPTIIEEYDMIDIDKSFIIEFLDEYFKENDLPEEELL
jgi:hypothetical protein